MRKKTLIVLGIALVIFALQSCSSSPEKSLLARYFNAVSLNDNATMASIALEPAQMNFTSWAVLSVTLEKIEPTTLPDLAKKEADAKKALEQHVAPTMEAKDLLDAAQEDLDLARTAGAKAAAKKKVEELQAKYDEEYNKHKDLQKAYNDAKAAAAAEEQITAFSLGVRDLANIRDLTGNVHSKEVEISVNLKDGAVRKYLLYMRMYDLKDEALNLNHMGRWVITKFQQIG
jgi:hypothetical protein